MPNYISLYLDSASSAGLSLYPYNKGNVCYFRVSNISGFQLQPSEKISVLIVPHDDPLTALDASGYLADPKISSDSSRGIYIYRYQNTEGSTKTVKELCNLALTSTDWENIKYDLYWLQEYGSGAIFSSGTSSVYSYPHNIQPNEVGIVAELVDDNIRMRYTLTFDEVNNSGSVDYGSDKPYLFNIFYKYGDGVLTGYFSGSTLEFSGAYDFKGFDPGAPTDGIVFDLPYYDPREGWNAVPAQYVFKVNYNCADPLVTGSFPLSIPINHQRLSDNELIDLDAWIGTNLDPTKLRKVDNIFIERGVIDRRRLSIGIKDISVRQNSYRKKGIYVSKPYSSDFPLYTFSLRTDEFIPDYPNLDPYNVVQYFVEFNSRPWLRISPINRNVETTSDGKAVPKMFVFDSDPGEGSESVSFLEYQAPVTIFRIKIAFDLSRLTDEQFIPPEIRDYDCITFDKNQLLEL